MFLQVKFSWNIKVPPIAFYDKNPMLQACVAACLVDEFTKKKANETHRYFLAVSALESIGDGRIREQEGHVVFPVVFTGITFRLFTGEVLKGVVHRVFRYGVLLRAGPVENIYLSHSCMPNYRYQSGKFIKKENNSKIEKGVVVRFIVIASRWMEVEKEFQPLASLEGYYLGPVLVKLGP